MPGCFVKRRRWCWMGRILHLARPSGRNGTRGKSSMSFDLVKRENVSLVRQVRNPSSILVVLSGECNALSSPHYSTPEFNALTTVIILTVEFASFSNEKHFINKHARIVTAELTYPIVGTYRNVLSRLNHHKRFNPTFTKSQNHFRARAVKDTCDNLMKIMSRYRH